MPLLKKVYLLLSLMSTEFSQYVPVFMYVNRLKQNVLTRGLTTGILMSVRGGSGDDPPRLPLAYCRICGCLFNQTGYSQRKIEECVD